MKFKLREEDLHRQAVILIFDLYGDFCLKIIFSWNRVELKLEMFILSRGVEMRADDD